MLIRKMIILTSVTALFVVLGCTTPPGQNQGTLLEKNWGRSFETVKYNQILNPEAGRNVEPVEGLDGEAAEANMAKYRQGFTSEAPPPVYDINLNNIGNIQGGK
jgi:hypothetical protein